MLLLCILLISIITSSNFEDLPEELLHSKVYGLLGVKDAIKCLSRLNNATYHNYFLSNHQNELHTIKILITFVSKQERGKVSSLRIAFITTLSNRIHFNEMYALILPKLLDDIIAIHTKNDVRRIMNAMKLRVMTIDEFCELPKDLNYKLKLLILSSRSLVPIDSGEPFGTNERDDNIKSFSL